MNDKYNQMVYETRGPIIQAPFQFLIEENVTALEYLILTLISDEAFDLLQLYHERVEHITIVLDKLIASGLLVKRNKLEQLEFKNLTVSTGLFMQLLNSNVTTWIDKWWALWPDGIKSSNYYIKTDKNGCIKKLEKFRRKYPQFTASLIIQATENYINRMSLAGYSFMKLAPYFVEKDGMSTLAGECEQIISETLNKNEIKKEKFGEVVYGG